MKKWFQHKLHARNKGNWISGLLRLCYFHLMIPILRSLDQPHLVARGVMMGLVLGSTPTVGIQMSLIFGVWWFSNYILRWRFSLILAMAWSFISNAFTMIPLYYLFYITGSVLTGNSESIQHFSLFSSIFADLNNPDQSFVKAFISSILLLWQRVGLSIFIGCIPFMIGLGITGYLLSYNLSRRFFDRRKTIIQRKKNNRLALRQENKEKK